MDGDLLTQLGVGGIFAVLVIREVLSFLAKKDSKNGTGSSETERDIKAITIDTNDRVKGMSALTSRIDGDGVPMIYTPRSIVATQKEISDAQAKTTQHLSEVAKSQADFAKAQADIAESVKKIETYHHD